MEISRASLEQLSRIWIDRRISYKKSTRSSFISKCFKECPSPPSFRQHIHPSITIHKSPDISHKCFRQVPSDMFIPNTAPWFSSMPQGFSSRSSGFPLSRKIKYFRSQAVLLSHTWCLIWLDHVGAVPFTIQLLRCQ